MEFPDTDYASSRQSRNLALILPTWQTEPSTRYLHIPECQSTPPCPPFIKIDGLHNFRDCGGYPILDQPGKIVRRGVIYRSEDPSRLTGQGIAQLQALGIAKTFDLRAECEIQLRNGNGLGEVREWDGCSRILASVFTVDYYQNEYYAKRARCVEGGAGSQGVVDYFRNILTCAAAADNLLQPLKSILGHLATSSPPSPEPILLHCSSGKDRTGVICALILSIRGVQDSIMTHEFGLTALGVGEKVADMITTLRPDNPGLTEREARFLRCTEEAMEGFLAWMQGQGGAEQYVVESGIMTVDQVQQLRRNLVVELGAGEEPNDWEEHQKMLGN
ncbi:protein-tyrosine phosphatase-like protein [Podospora appendiculata]|uniref:Protein-tyrosine phosphatase-like protein n=1 Tax=Podospora appendiculata TaxID=314037 RepID=A0AAE0X6K3_9PEZI|nr:protein-tyrosine phosphatase-like protein [Podospora appendiculata]